MIVGDTLSAEEVEIPLKPITRTDIHRLEIALMLGTLLRPDVIERIKVPEERLTWIDSLGVAAGALARSSAGMPVSRIAEELGRSEATIRRHLAGKTEAGRLVRETYERFAREGVRIELPSELLGARGEEVEKLRRERDELAERLARVREKLKEALSLLE